LETVKKILDFGAWASKVLRARVHGSATAPWLIQRPARNKRTLMLNTISPSRLVAFLLIALLASTSIAQEPPTSRPATRLACVGDSITYGAGIKDREHDSYPAQLGRMLGEGWDVRNFGVSGATMLKQGNKPYDKEKAYREALAWKPDVVVIMLGTNDSKPQNWSHKDDYASDYKSLIAAFRETNPSVKIYACTPVPAWDNRFKIRGEVIDNEEVPLVNQVANENDTKIIDLRGALDGKKEVFPDGVHPNEEGARLMAAAVYEGLTGKAAPASQPVGAAH
jgi:lysophospholipase L1-like esterase